MKSSPQHYIQKNRAGFSIIALLFSLSGFSTILHIITIPHIQSALTIRYVPIGIIQFSFFLAFFLLSPLAGYLFQKRSYLEGLRAGIVTECFGTLFIFIATALHSFPMIILGTFVIGAGIAMIQVAGNPYLFLLQTKESHAGRVVIAHAYTSLGAVIAPYIGSHCLFSMIYSSDTSIQFLYLSLAILWAGSLIATYCFELPEGEEMEPNKRSLENEDSHPLKEVFVLLGVIGIGIAMGVEMAVSNYLVKIMAGKYLMVFFFGYFIGRALGSQALIRILPEKLLLMHALAGIGLMIITLIMSGYAAILSVAALGIAFSMFYPLIYSFVLEGSQSRKSEVSGYLCMAGMLGAVFPMAQGVLTDWIGTQAAFVLPLSGVVYLAVYARYLTKRALRRCEVA